MATLITTYWSWHISSKKLQIQLSREGPEKWGFTEKGVGSEGSWVASLMSKEKMEAFDSPRSSSDWTSACCPELRFLPVPGVGDKGGEEWQVLIFSMIFDCSTYPCSVTDPKEGIGAWEIATVILCDKGDRAYNPLLPWRSLERRPTSESLILTL